MAHIDIRPAALMRIAGSCEDFVTPWVAAAKRELGDGEGALGAATIELRRTPGGAAGIGLLETAGAAEACVAGWQETLGQASGAMHAVTTKLRSTAGAVMSTDQDAANLYRGPVPDLPDISVDLTR